MRVSNPYITDSSNVFTDNSAPYGADKATYPYILEFYDLKNNDYYEPYVQTESVSLQGGERILF